MNIPTWAIFVGSAVLYFLIGFILATIAAYLKGRNPTGLIGFFEGPSWAFFWPFMVILTTAFFILDVYMSFLMKVEERGKQSVMSPENESPGRIVS